MEVFTAENMMNTDRKIKDNLQFITRHIVERFRKRALLIIRIGVKKRAI